MKIDLGPQTQVEDRERILIGAGAMGQNYLGALDRSGIDMRTVGVVDINPERLAKVAQQYPGIAVGNTLPERAPQTAYVVSNTPIHKPNLEALSALNTPAVLCEKPIIMANQIDSSLEALISRFSHGHSAYLINFSPAMTELLELMHSKNLAVIGGSGTWTKDRRGDSRPTTGDLEDEMTHQLSALFLLARAGQEVKSLAVSAKLEYVPFVNEAAQRALAALDPSIPLNPNSSTDLTLRLGTNRAASPIDLRMFSSFVAPTQERVIRVNLSPDGGTISHTAEIQFDLPRIRGDLLTITETGSASPDVRIFEKPDKLARQIKAFTDAVEGTRKDPLLKTLTDGLQMVRMSAAAIESDGLQQKFIELITQK